MKILNVGAVKGGSVPVGHAIHTAFSAIGVDSELLDYSDLQGELDHILLTREPALSSSFLKKCEERLLDKITGCKPDLILGIAQSPLNNINLLKMLKNEGIKLCYWFVEDCRVFSYWNRLASHFDYFFLIQREPYIRKMNQMGCPNVYYLPTAFDTNIATNGSVNERKISISFMGAPYPNRIYHFAQLERNDFQIFGEGWTSKDHPRVVIGNRRISDSEARNIYRRTIINMNLHSSTNPQSFSGGDFVNPRTFELAGLGAFQLVDYRKLLPLHFDIGSELVVFRKWDEMVTAIDHFLMNEEERNRISKRAQQRVLREHTYENRARQILSILNRQE